MITNFKQDLIVIPSKQEEKKKMELEAYRLFISEALPGYICFMEALNNTINALQEKNIIGKTKLRARLKAVNSALINTQKKILDDVFGFEIVTDNERDKEVLMLLIHNLFVEDYSRHKNFNKSNGYFAHHCTGTVKNKLSGTEVIALEQHILNSETNELKPEYRDLSRKEQSQYKKSEIYWEKPRYPVLKQEILEKGEIDSGLKKAFERGLNSFQQCLDNNVILKRSIPIVEIQFKTKEVEQETKCGRAQHVKYKKVNEDEIVKKYFERKLARGVDFPFVFVRNKEGNLEIEHTSKTLVNMWPFLDDAVSKYHKIHDCPVANYDMYFAKIFPDLEPYVIKNLTNEPSLPSDKCDEVMAWSIIKNKIINNSFILPDASEIIGVIERN